MFSGACKNETMYNLLFFKKKADGCMVLLLFLTVYLTFIEIMHENGPFTSVNVE